MRRAPRDFTEGEARILRRRVCQRKVSNVTLNIAKKSRYTDTGEPVGKASGRTFNRMSTYVPDSAGVHYG
jgi:hypothetical protein